MNYLWTIFFLLIAAASFSKPIEIINNSDYTIIVLHGPTKNIYIPRQHHNHLKILKTAAHQKVSPHTRETLTIDDDLPTTIYAYRLTSESIKRVVDQLKEAVLDDDGLPDLSKFNWQALRSVFQEGTLKRAFEIRFNDDGPMRYIDIMPSTIDDEQAIVVRNKPDAGTIDALIIKNREFADDDEQQAAIEQSGKIISIDNQSKNPILVIYGKKLWGETFSRFRLDLKANFLSKTNSQKRVISSKERFDIMVPAGEDDVTQIFFYRISAADALANVQKITALIASGALQSAVSNAAGIGLVDGALKAIQLYSAAKKAKQELPFTSLTINEQNLEACQTIRVNDSRKEVIKVNCGDAPSDAKGHEKSDEEED